MTAIAWYLLFTFTVSWLSVFADIFTSLAASMIEPCPMVTVANVFSLAKNAGQSVASVMKSSSLPSRKSAVVSRNEIFGSEIA